MFKFKEKYSRSAALIALSLTAVFALREIFSFIYGLATRASGFGAYGETLISGIIYVIMILCPCVFLSVTEKTKFRDVLSPWKDERPDYLPYLTLRGMEFIVAANIAASYFAAILENAGVKNIAPDTAFPFEKEQTFGIILTVLFEAVLPGILEELLFRGFIMKRLLEFGEGCAIFVSALCFGLMHIYPSQAFFAFLVGLVIAKYDIKYGSLKVGIILHILNNYMSCMFGISEKYMEPSAYSAMVMGLFMTLITLGIISGFGIRRLDKKYAGANENKNGGKVPAYKIIFNPLMIVFYAAAAFNIWMLVR